jgi:hypothetical protein
MSDSEDKIASAVEACMYYGKRAAAPKSFVSDFIALLRADPNWKPGEIDEVECTVGNSLGAGRLPEEPGTTLDVVDGTDSTGEVLNAAK